MVFKALNGWASKRSSPKWQNCQSLFSDIFIYHKNDGATIKPTEGSDCGLVVGIVRIFFSSRKFNEIALTNKSVVSNRIIDKYPTYNFRGKIAVNQSPVFEHERLNSTEETIFFYYAQIKCFRVLLFI